MAAAKKSAAAKAGAAPAAPRLPFGLRFRAWWEGYDPAELAARLAGEAAAATPDASATPEPAAAHPADAATLLGVPLPGADTGTPAGAASESARVDSWTDQRIAVMDLIWGEGFCGPGGSDYIINATKLLTFSADMSVADINCGLGGPARALAHAYGLWVSGFTPSARLVEAGNALSARAGQGRKAELSVLDLADEAPFQLRRFDRIVGTGYLSQWPDHALAMQKVDEALKSDGMALFSDFMLVDGAAADDPTVRAWLSGQGEPLYPMEEAAFEALAHDVHWMVRVNDDISGEHARLLADGWRGAEAIVGKLMGSPEGRVLGQAVMQEAERTNRLLAALRTGKLRKRRMLIAKLPRVAR